MSDEFEVLDITEAIKVKHSKVVTGKIDPKYIKAIDAISDGGVIFLPGARVNSLSQYRLYCTVRLGRKLHSRKGEREGVEGMYIWAGPVRE